jgi:hypothetical protein
VQLNSSTRTPHLFTPHPNLTDEVNHNIAQSEIEGGVHLEDLVQGSRLEILTQHRWYTVVNCDGGQALISGHPKYCPRPLLVRIMGSTWGGSMLKMCFIGRSMHLEFKHPEYRTAITTSRIVEIREPHIPRNRVFGPLTCPAPTKMRES